MVKNTTSREDSVIKELKKAFPTYSFGNPLDMARLVKPDSFDYKNRTRLENEFTKKIIQSIADITLLIQYVNAKRKGIMDFSKFDKVDQDYLASFYPNMVKHGIKGITNNLPQEFTALIEEHLKPLLLLLSSITAYSKQVGKSGSSAYGHGKTELWDGTL